MSYKKTLITVSDLKWKSISALHKRVTLLNQVFADPDFRADLGGVDDFALASALDRYLDDTPFRFLEARWLLEQRPKAEDWQNKSPRVLYDELQSMAKDRDKEIDEESPRARWSVTKKQWDEKCRECDDLRAEMRKLKAESERMGGELQELRQELRFWKQQRLASGSVPSESREPLAVA